MQRTSFLLKGNKYYFCFEMLFSCLSIAEAYSGIDTAWREMRQKIFCSINREIEAFGASCEVNFK